MARLRVSGGAGVCRGVRRGWSSPFWSHCAFNPFSPFLRRYLAIPVPSVSVQFLALSLVTSELLVLPHSIVYIHTRLLHPHAFMFALSPVPVSVIPSPHFHSTGGRASLVTSSFLTSRSKLERHDSQLSCYRTVRVTHGRPLGLHTRMLPDIWNPARRQ
ncbi:hypothetical protein C8R47DRAFT_657804 [Mycena vitilis]|nr:hypothetical protein C8R47DRAFT_657804 [Mycena vitilis]